jgi:hypothetical protein
VSGAEWFLLGTAAGAAGPAWWLSWRYGINPFAAFGEELGRRFRR